MRFGELISSTVNSNYADSLGGQGGPLGTTRAEILYANNIDVFLRPIFATTATEEFDKLCFDFGIELDEDVRTIYFEINQSHLIAMCGSDYRRGGGFDQSGFACRAPGACVRTIACAH